MTDPLTTPLDAEESALAARLRALPGGEPSPELDARIRGAAHAAVRVRRTRPRWQRWGGALAAVLALGVGLRVTLQPAPLPSSESAPLPTNPAARASADSIAPTRQTEGVELHDAAEVPASLDSAANSAREVQAPARRAPATAAPSPEKRDARREQVSVPEAFPSGAAQSSASVSEREALSPAPPVQRSAGEAAALQPSPESVGRLKQTLVVPQDTPPQVDRLRSAPAAPPMPAPPSPRESDSIQSKARASTDDEAQSDDDLMRSRDAAPAPAPPPPAPATAATAGKRAGANALSEARSNATPLAILISDARRQHAADDLDSLRDTLFELRLHYADADLPDDVSRWMRQFDEQR